MAFEVSCYNCGLTLTVRTWEDEVLEGWDIPPLSIMCGDCKAARDAVPE